MHFFIQRCSSRVKTAFWMTIMLCIFPTALMIVIEPLISILFPIFLYFIIFLFSLFRMFEDEEKALAVIVDVPVPNLIDTPTVLDIHETAIGNRDASFDQALESENLENLFI